MAQAFFERAAGDGTIAESAGSASVCRACSGRSGAASCSIPSLGRLSRCFLSGEGHGRIRPGYARPSLLKIRVTRRIGGLPVLERRCSRGFGSSRDGSVEGVVASPWRRIRARAGWVRPVVLGSVLLTASACGSAGLGGQRTGHAVVSNIDPRTTALTLSKTDEGGVEAVLASDASDSVTVEGVRALLREQAAQFQQGRYQDPAREHGMVMPGSRELEAGYAGVRVGYADLPAGGQITYVANDPALVNALHAWFDRRASAR